MPVARAAVRQTRQPRRPGRMGRTICSAAAPLAGRWQPRTSWHSHMPDWARPRSWNLRRRWLFHQHRWRLGAVGVLGGALPHERDVAVGARGSRVRGAQGGGPPTARVLAQPHPVARRRRLRTAPRLHRWRMTSRATRTSATRRLSPRGSKEPPGCPPRREHSTAMRCRGARPSLRAAPATCGICSANWSEAKLPG